jgi:hypothetical protein
MLELFGKCRRKLKKKKNLPATIRRRFGNPQVRKNLSAYVSKRAQKSFHWLIGDENTLEKPIGSEKSREPFR